MEDLCAFLALLIAGFKPAGPRITDQEVYDLMRIFKGIFPSFSLDDVVALKRQLYKKALKKPNCDFSQKTFELHSMVNMLGCFERLLKESMESKLVVHL